MGHRRAAPGGRQGRHRRRRGPRRPRRRPGDEAVEVELEWRHRPTEPFDLRTGQGNGHVQYSFAAHRAVVEVDTELGLVKVVELACAQDVGKALNPLSVVGQIQGGTTQGLGVAVMEEIIVDPKTAKVRNPSFTDYLIPTILDTPTIPVDVLELADDHAPYGLRGVGEAPDPVVHPGRPRGDPATRPGLELNRTPVRPEHLTGTDGVARADRPSGRCAWERHTSAAPPGVREYRTARGTCNRTAARTPQYARRVPFVSGRPPGRAADAPSQIPQSPASSAGAPVNLGSQAHMTQQSLEPQDHRGGRGRRLAASRPDGPGSTGTSTYPTEDRPSRARCAAASPPSWRWRTSCCSTRCILSGKDVAGNTLGQPALITATALAAAVTTLLMGFVGKVPLALAAGLSRLRRARLAGRPAHDLAAGHGHVRDVRRGDHAPGRHRPPRDDHERDPARAQARASPWASACSSP